MPLSRRQFLATSAVVAGPMLARAASTPSADSTAFAEPNLTPPLAADCDVIVCGAGPAGVTAAITAARAGARVRLFEAHGALGGVWTSSLLGYLLDFDKPGFNQELVRELDRRDARRIPTRDAMTYEPEEMKVLLDELCVDAGVKLQLHTRVAAAYRDGRRLATIVTESKSGRQAWRAPVFIDATGDGDLGALAGCGWETGETKACPCQPLSMCALLTVRDPAALAACIHPVGGGAPNEAAKRAFLAEIQRAGITPSYAKPTLFPIRDNLLLAMMNHEYSILAFDAARITEATIRARAELHRIVRGLRKLGGAWEGVQLVATPEQIGVRDGRRIRGRYTVQRDDLVAGARHADAVVRPTFSVDIHAYDRTHAGGGYTNTGIKVKPYDIPYRALVARDVDGLLLAGRCISGDYIAHSSYRVTGNAVAMGEAAGAAAALAAQSRSLPHDLPWRDIAAVRDKTRRPA
ncbi:MAG: FAD-dependent oxidoreductase [Verrucomicrobia bacterium]|nr:FAD-dependent oxidoreductase [Verrucomicrobiota bacterium]